MSNANIVNLNTVKDLKSWLENPNNVYVGRSHCDIAKYSKPGYSDWGNPWKLSRFKSREQVVHLYKNYVLHTKYLIETVGDLHGKILGCWCAPNTCHAEILHQLAGNFPVYQKYNSREPHTASMEEVGTSTSEMATPTNEGNTRKYVELDSTVYFDCYNIPDQATIVFAVSRQFSADKSKNLYSLYQGIWS